MATEAELTKQYEAGDLGNQFSHDFTLTSKDDNLFEHISGLALRFGGLAMFEHRYGEDDLRITINILFSDEDYTNGNYAKFQSVLDALWEATGSTNHERNEDPAAYDARMGVTV